MKNTPRASSPPRLRSSGEQRRGDPEEPGKHAGVTTDVPPSPRRVALASAVGATIEWYDFFLEWWVAAYNVLVAAFSLTCVRFLPETRGRTLDSVDPALEPVREREAVVA